MRSSVLGPTPGAVSQAAMTGLLTALIWVALPSALRADRPDLTWQPRPFAFEPGAVSRYIDYESGADGNPGTRERPWKHHPWDPDATGEAAKATGIDTYCFRRGAVYRGVLAARDSGTDERPIRLTVDPSWGEGEASLWGSVRVQGGWRRCTEAEAPSIPADGRDETWFIDLDGSFVPRLVWELRDDDVRRIPIARTPNWTIVSPDDPRSEWWELTGYVLEVRVELDSSEGFAVGDRITGTGRWADVNEDRDNIAEGRNRVTEVGEGFIRIDASEWKKGEIQPGATITNGQARAKVKGLPSSHDIVSRLKDTQHLIEPDPSYYAGATMWAEGETMPKPDAEKILSYDPQEQSLRLRYHRGTAGPTTYCRYFLEGLPQFLDEPGEYCYVEEGAHAGRLFLRLPGDRDPNRSTIELARELIPIDLHNASHVEVSGLDIRFSNAIPCGTAEARHAPVHAAAIRILGTCSDIDIHNCTIAHVPNGVVGWVEKDADVLDRIRVGDNDLHDVDGCAIDIGNGRNHYALKDAGARLIHADILRNRVQNVGARRLQHWGPGLHAINLEGAELAEVAGNIVDTSWGAGIRVFNGGDFECGGVERPLIRGLIHHNKATNTLLGLQDYGGIASWMAGPSYVYSNISGNAVGYKHHNYRRSDRKDWYRTSCYGVGIYIDGQYKGYVFNNIIWGNSNDVNDRIYNSCAFNEAMGFLNTVFSNTVFRCGVGLHKGMTQHNRCLYLGNLMLDIGHKFIQQEPRPEAIEHGSLAYARNVFLGEPPNFGQLGADVYETFTDWQVGLAERQAMAAETGTLATAEQVADAEAHDFALQPTSVAIDTGAKVFVPWGLYAVVGEWSFLKHPQDPAIILGENINWDAEWYRRDMFGDIPRNDLTGHGIDASNFGLGTLENWTDGALALNGRDEYCAIMDADLKRDYPSPAGGGIYPGDKRATVDMDTNSFAIEVVLKAGPGSAGGGIVSKCRDTGYVLAIGSDGGVTMGLHFGGQHCSRASAARIADGKWHHLVAEVHRAEPQGINLYVDGRLSNGEWSGTMATTASLSNTADFVVGKTQRGAAGQVERFFAGQLDFLRVSRGTLADAETTIEELYGWEFDGPALRDFAGRLPRGNGRDVGAVEYAPGD
jgi:hypothetical protein